MKRISFILTFLVLSIASGYSQNTQAKIQVIRDHFGWIEKQKNYNLVKLENQEFLDDEMSEGAGATGYFLDGKLYKIVESEFGSTSKYTTRYYFWNDTLFFIYATIEQYGYNSQTGTIDYDKAETTYEGRFYYDNGKLIKRLEKGSSNGSYDPTTLPKEANKILLYMYVKSWNGDKYKMLTGKWTSSDDPKYKLEINGMVVDEYYDGDYTGTFRWLIVKDNIYAQEVGTDNQVKYKLLKLTANELQISNLARGNTIIFKKSN